ncbi:hypothetical protein PILCRDRAFT_828356 [Piloderma croceum F 1598]|nr:hypothetical protein PILCRDRAFT_828356 [Piloderma croceum F 1598]
MAADQEGQNIRDALSTSSQKVLHEIQHPQGPPVIVGDDDEVNWEDFQDPNTPMDSEITLTGEGDEVEVLRELSGVHRKRRDLRTWGARIRTREIKWAEQLDILTDTYLRWKSNPSDVEAEGDEFAVEYVDIYNYSASKTFTHIASSRTWNATLLAHGCLSSTPDVVTSVISLRTLELYRRLRLRHAPLSIQAWIKVICDLHNLSYTRSLWRQFVDTFDVYLMILRQVKKRTDLELGCSTADWRMLNSCPACQYKLEDEPPLVPAIEGSMDGGQSLRRVAMREDLHEDPRTFASSYLIGEEDVDRFKHDVKPRPPRKKKNNEPNELPTWAADQEQAGAADGDTEGTTCTDRWQAAMSDIMKRMWAIYRESGIFLAACRHGFIWLILDMIRSGELAKYPLAIIDRLLRVYGKDIGLGYDIVCSFLATIAKSSLSAVAREKALQLVVPAFHGYAHNCACQLGHHPLYVVGFGIEDFEGCERIFSSSNFLARLTRHATRFHRHQSMDMHFTQWDEDKYTELTTFLFNNYKQVNGLLTDMPLAIVALESGKTPEECDYAGHLETERAYLASRKKEPEADIIASKYISLLVVYEEAMKQSEKVNALTSDAVRTAELRGRPAMAKLDAFESVTQIREMVAAYELLHEIPERWTPDSKEWKCAVKYTMVRDFQKALDKLEALVVQRLFELSKMGLAGTGYKMRVHINKGLRARCKAIQNALKKYNVTAVKIGRPVLDWKSISTYGSLAEFSLLRECREDIRSQPWTQAANRQAGIHSLKLTRAYEERKRLNTEVRHVATSIRDEELDFEAHITRVNATDSPLAAELCDIRDRRIRVNRLHKARLSQIHTLIHFNGTTTMGTRIGRVGTETDKDMGCDREVDGTEVSADGEDPEPDEDNAMAVQLATLEIFYEQLSVRAATDDE